MDVLTLHDKKQKQKKTLKKTENFFVIMRIWNHAYMNST